MQEYLFKCSCGFSKFIGPLDDPTTSSGCCPACGTKDHVIFDNNGYLVG